MLERVSIGVDRNPDRRLAPNSVQVTQMRNWTEKPNSVPWPPILFLCAAGAAFGLGIVYPLGTAALTGDFPRGVGIAAMLAGLGLDIAAMLTMRREHANILPHRAATALVTKGPFALSRNPIYLGNTLLLGGAGFVFANAWLLLAAAAAAQAVSVLAIRREEAHLAAKFGAAWAEYARRTPRWLWRNR